MQNRIYQSKLLGAVLVTLLFLGATSANATIDGISGTSFNFTAKADHIDTPEGGNPLIWGFANGSNRAQYPGPTLILNQNQTVTIELTSELGRAVSIVFPGQQNVAASGGSQGILTRESTGPSDTVTYSFTASQPGTYIYHSGTNLDLQVEMGLFGAIIVRPVEGAGQAYNTADTSFDHEYLFLLSEMDPRIHLLVEHEDNPVGTAETLLAMTDYLSDYFPKYWFINGRCAPDTLFPPGVPWLPTQPYNCLPVMSPGEKVLMRIAGGGRHSHPLHHHGNHAWLIAKNGRLLESTPGAGADLSVYEYTPLSVPGETIDKIFTWSGKGLGWDMYGHDSDDPATLMPGEHVEDHGKPFPVTLPEQSDLYLGDFYGGSPFLGVEGPLPPGAGSLYLGGYMFMWHSHHEKELLNWGQFPGGMMTMPILVAPVAP